MVGNVNDLSIICAPKTHDMELTEVRLQLLNSNEFFSLTYNELDKRLSHDMDIKDFNTFIDCLTDLYDKKRRDFPDVSLDSPTYPEQITVEQYI